MTQAHIGVIGVGTMGSALALNFAEKGQNVALWNLELDMVDRLVASAGDLSARLQRCESLADLVTALPVPRTIVLMIPAGTPVDQTIAALRPLLSAGDTIIDGGNSDFRDTMIRTKTLEDAGLCYLGIGVSGGAEGARRGPSMMVGGTRSSYSHVAPILEAIAARYEGDPCVAHLGSDGAGHFVKTVHNGIEYADMQMIAEVYGMMRDGAGLAASDIAPVFRGWNRGLLESYLIEVTGEVLATKDPQTGEDMVDLIADQAGQKGTGRWTVIEAVRMGQVAGIIEAAVGARVMSAQKSTRERASTILVPAGTDTMIPVSEHDLQSALIVGRILSYAQGFEILAAGSTKFNWLLDFARIAEIWRAGCIIRSAMLDDIATTFRSQRLAGHLALSDHFIPMLTTHIAGLRRVVSAAALKGLPTPALAAALSWFDMIRQERGTSDLIQAQRDYFGAHSFERVDAEGSHHGPWHAG
ncbi:MAG: phosphogluconate dehydrogenase (NADP(+)-dependent, decarboxylating) [Rhodobacteraceae bacterium]|nr:phosphogluconate dehydrogenase (NADP(+)-dependent, decarboxylating) [Paracoccaceae bacterium]